jgi:protein-S-isoprenylcysteine O-methyltransferase Ste14
MRFGPAGVGSGAFVENSVMRSWKHLRTILLLPGMVTIAIPGTILRLTGPDTLGVWRSIPASKVVLPILGGACLGSGLVLALATIRLFMTFGEGTIAPWDPPQRLVVRGVYRHVRNPMISGLCLELLGESLLAASLPLLVLFAFGVIINVIYIPLSEEPGLARRFGDDYLRYKRYVPRWIPRLKPWRPDDLPGKVVRL